MLLSYRPFFQTMTLILTLGVSSCTTNDHTPKPNPKLQLIKNIPYTQAKKPPSTGVSRHKSRSPEQKRIFPKLNTLQNLTSNQVQALLGAPSFKRSDNPAEIWQYRTYKCTLDLFLYKNSGTSVRRVTYYEIRLQPGQALTNNECFEIVIKISSQTF
jgi:hypothetical protein